MSKASEYFSKVKYKPTYFLGDRVRGFFNKVPFSGTVDIDNHVYEGQDPFVIVHLDLPIVIDNIIYKMITVAHSDIIENKQSYGLNSKTISKKSTMDSGRRRKKSR